MTKEYVLCIQINYKHMAMTFMVLDQMRYLRLLSIVLCVEDC